MVNKKLKIIFFIFGIATFSCLASLSTFFLIVTDRSKYIPFDSELKQFSVRMGNSIRNSNKTNTKWSFQKEYLLSHWYSLQKEVINAKSFLELRADPFTGKAIKGSIQYTPPGYLDLYDENYLIGVSGKGKIFWMSLEKKEFQEIKSNLPIIYKNQNFKGKEIPEVIGGFGVRDIFVDKKRNMVFVSINIEVTDDCYGMAIYQSNLNQPSIKEIQNIKFKKLFETENCNSQFPGHGAGGRIAGIGESLIFTIGDLDHNMNGDPNIPQSYENAISKVLLIDKEGKFKILSRGHRNPQGLYILNKDKILTTEHGPTGGDEVNLIDLTQKPKHYGWPFFSYGHQRSRKVFRFRHDGEYEEPIHYFTPSIGISQLLLYEGNEFPTWQNKLIVSSLKAKSLFLLDYDQKNNRIISKEDIKIGHRIRDLVLLPDGKLLLVTDDQNIIILSRSKHQTVKEGYKVPFDPNECWEHVDEFVGIKRPKCEIN